MAKIRSVSKQQWLADQVRGQILDQNLPSGHKLPTDNELIRKYQVSRITVVQAMKRLAEEGLVRREVGRGTFIADRTRGGEIGVILSRELLASESSPYFRMTAAKLMHAISDASRDWRGQMHLATLTGRLGEAPQDVGLLEDESLLRDVRGVFSFHPLHEKTSMLTEHGIPWVCLGRSSDEDYSVYFDANDMYRQAAAHLLERGCRTVGSLWQCYWHWIRSGQGETTAWSRVATDAGLHCPPEFNLFRDEPYITERGGWELFHKLWKQRRKPDGLFIQDEILARGALRAALELGVRFPEDIRLIIGKTRGVDVPYHEPITALEADPDRQVSVAIEIMNELVAGKTPTKRQTLLPVTLVPGEST